MKKYERFKGEGNIPHDWVDRIVMLWRENTMRMEGHEDPTHAYWRIANRYYADPHKLTIAKVDRGDHGYQLLRDGYVILWAFIYYLIDT
jgi:hypothetical protein